MGNVELHDRSVAIIRQVLILAPSPALGVHTIKVFVRAIDEAPGVCLLAIINGGRLETEFEGPRTILFISATDAYHIIIRLGSSD